MSVTAVSGGPNSDLHMLLESLNDLGSGPSRRDANIPWNRSMIWNRRIHFIVETFSFTTRYSFDTEDKIGEWERDIQCNDSLCDILDIEANFELYLRITGSFCGRDLDLFLTGRTYPETKSIIDRWGQSLFLIPLIPTNMWASVIIAKRKVALESHT